MVGQVFGFLPRKANMPPQENKEKKMALTVEAAKIANAFNFIAGMPDGFETRVGDRGFLLSGGQKQRIAIARAVISNPKILLLDEATSALDTQSEAAVQAAIEAASKERTTVIIAHRLSTIREADNIAVMNDGEIVEQGRHNELLKYDGVYSRLVQAQRMGRKTSSPPAKSSKPSSRSGTDGFDDPEVALRRSEHDEKASLGLQTQSRTKSDNSLRALVEFIWSLSKQDRRIILLGTVFSTISGGNQPARGIIFAHAIVAISLPLSQVAQIRHESNFWAGMFLVLGFAQLFASSGQGVAFALSSERLICRAQSLVFRSILRQDVAFFDKHENSPGALASLLSSEANRLAGISGATLGVVLVFAVTVFGSIGISLRFGWKLSLVCISVMPILIVCGFLRFWILAKYDERTKRTTEAAGLGSEATSAIRTVASLTIQDKILQEYHHLLVNEARQNAGFIAKSAAAYALSQSFLLLSLALGFWYGGHLLVDHKYTTTQFFICFSETLFGAQAAGAILSFAPEMGSGRSAAESFKRLVNSKPEIDGLLKQRRKARALAKEQLSYGTSGFDTQNGRRSKFSTISVLASSLISLSLSWEPVAAESLQRLPLSSVSMTPRPAQSSLMAKIYLLSTSPIIEATWRLSVKILLFTVVQIRDNLVIGGGPGEVLEQNIVEACKAANIYDFVLSLPEGFNTLVGAKGSSVSGGQGQRIAIARALLRKPKIL